MTRRPPPLPDDEALQAFIEASPSPPKLREIAKAFGLVPQQRAALRARLHALAARAPLTQAADDGRPPAISLFQITSVDSDGYGLARPADSADDDDSAIVVLPSAKRGKAIQAGDRVLARLRTGPDDVLQAEVMRILPKQKSHIFGRAVNTGSKAHPRWYLEPAEKGGKKDVPIKGLSGLEFSENDLLEAELIKEGGLRLVAQPVRNLGSADHADAFTALAIAEFDLRHSFSDEMINAANKATLPELERRRDLRALPLVTIDGEDAKDFDDAVFAEPAEDNNWRLIVAIADVSTYVKDGDVLDKEARLRGNSVYLPGSVIPMLPEALSNGLCSLRPDEDRACLAVEIIIDEQGQKLSHTFFQALIRSSARLTYTTVQQVIEGSIDESDCGVNAGTIHHLIGAYRVLHDARQRRGTLNLDLSETRIQFDETGTPVSAVQHRQKDAHQLIEEFMILANICAAETLEQARQLCVYRVHDQPDPEKIESLRELTQALSLPFAKGQVVTPHRFNDLLAKVKGTESETAVNEAVLRCQARAVYAPDNIGHYGLGLSRYAHFTSPIRRYADLLVHRSLIKALEMSSDSRQKDKAESRALLKQICAAISQTEQTAAKAERRTTSRLAAKILSHKQIKDVEVTVTGLTKAGLFVKLDDGACEGFVPRRTLPDDFYETVAGGMMLAGRHHGWLFRLGDKLVCRLEEIAPASGDITLSWLNGGDCQPGKTGGSRKKYNARSKARRGPVKRRRR